MAGIYIHIPFCKTRCIYCGFFSTTSLEKREVYVDAVCKELIDRKDYLKGEPVETIYFGGGTPSQLLPEQIARILNQIYIIYNVRAKAEITLEGNPDDLSPDFLSKIKEIGINRLSMGIQSFDDERLRFLRRRHSSAQARKAVENAIIAGFENISVDLMFGFPGQTLQEWKNDVEEALKLPLKHISAYSLMYDEGTALSNMLESGKIEELDEELSVQMFRHLVSTLKTAGFEHYEISNFCRKGYHSRHNSSYWHGVLYLGVGAGAHSYDGESRQFNPDSLQEYMSGAVPQREELSLDERYNEFVFTSLRTNKGMNLSELQKRFGWEYYDYCMNNAKRHLEVGRLVVLSSDSPCLCLSSEGIFVSNDIISDLMVVE